MKNYILCCDWGTSFFRLGLITLDNYRLEGEVCSEKGIAHTFDAWKATAASDNINKYNFFRQELKVQVTGLAQKLSVDLNHVPLLISGMASSSIGMEEIPYAALPFALDGSGANMKLFDADNGFPHKLMLISGVKSTDDVMRGEETQLIGLLELLSITNFKRPDTVFIFPGTHSKHIYINETAMLSFKTYMTGEVFNLMANNSILKDSVDAGLSAPVTAHQLAAFKLGVRESQAADILYNLFTVRTNQLFGSLDKQQNYLYLSGLLIGAELKHLLQQQCRLVLCSGNKLQLYYQLAIEELQLAGRTTIIPSAMIDKAAFVGQASIFKNHQVMLTNKESL